MDKELKSLRTVFCKVVEIKEGGIGELAALETSRLDIECLSHQYPEAKGLSNLLKTLSDEITNDRKKIKLDFNGLKNSRLDICKAYATDCNEQLINQEKYLRCIRAAILISHLSLKKKLPQSLAKSLRFLFEGKYSDIPFGADLSKEGIIELQRNHSEPGSEVYRLLSTLILSLRASFSIDLDSYSEVDFSKLENSGLTQIDQDKTNQSLTNVKSKKERVPQPIHENGSLIYYLAKSFKFATPKDFSGANNAWASLNSDELRGYSKSVIKDFHEVKNKLGEERLTEVLLGILVSIHIQKGPGFFNLVGLNSSNGTDVWINLFDGCLCWNRAVLLSLNGDDSESALDESNIFRIPLPSELIVELKIKAVANSSATRLGHLFATPLRELKKDMKQYSFNYTKSAHKPHTSRLSKGFGGDVLATCKDDAYSAVISLDWRLTTQSTFYYFNAEPKRLNKICKEVYANLGYTQGLYKEVEVAAGSKLARSDQQLSELICLQLQSAVKRFNHFNCRISFSELMEIHNEIVVAIFAPLASVLALRRSEEYSIYSHTIDIEMRRILVTDKASSPYLAVRLLPIPNWLLGWLEFYDAWLSRVASRLNQVSPSLGAELTTTLKRHTCSLAKGPLFFLIFKDRLEPLGSKHLKPIFQRWNIPVNAGRHVMDFKLRQITNSSLVNVFMGHANPGQEGLGLRSAVTVNLAMEEISAALDQIIENMQLPVAPKVKPIGFSQLDESRLLRNFRPKLWEVRSSEDVKVDSRTELCPFHEYSLLNANCFKKLFVDWNSSCCHFRLCDVALALIFFDGVIAHSELTLALSELLTGKIYTDDKYYFIDVTSAQVGLRRIVLSEKTLLILQEHLVRNPDSCLENAEKKISQDLNEFLTHYRAGANQHQNALELICAFGRDFYSLIVHGPLREWMKLLINARTIRPESHARRTFGFVERIEFPVGRVRNSKFVLTDINIIKALDTAVDNNVNFGSNLIRIRDLKDSLVLMMDQFTNLFDLVGAKFIVYLCNELKSQAPGSIRNHYFGIRVFLKYVTQGLGSFEEFTQQNWYVKFDEFWRTNSLSKKDILSINRFFRMLGIHSGLTVKNGAGKLPTSSGIRVYADFASDSEVKQINSLIPNLNLPNALKDQLLVMLRLVDSGCLRRQDVATLRLKDLQVTNGAMTLVVTSQTIGTKKSKNANRVIDISSSGHDELLALVEAKQQIFPDQSAGIFSSLDNPESFEGGYDILAIISQCKKAVSGAVNLRPHQFRTRHVSTTVRHILSVEYSSCVPSDIQRLALYEMFISSGHGDFATVFENYVCDMEWVRREWVDHVSKQHFLSSAVFLSSVTAFKQSTLTKYASNPKRLTNYISKYFLDLSLAFAQRVEPIRNYLVEGIEVYPFEDNLIAPAQDSQKDIIKYRMINLAGIESGPASLVLSIPEQERQANDHAFSILKLASRADWTSNISAKEILTSPILNRLITKLGAMSFSQKQIIGIPQLIPSTLGEPWELDLDSFALLSVDLISLLRLAGVEVVFMFCETLQSQLVESVVAELQPKFCERQRRRNFSKTITAKVKFVFKEDAGNKPAWPVRSKIATDWVSMFLLCLLINCLRERAR